MTKAAVVGPAAIFQISTQTGHQRLRSSDAVAGLPMTIHFVAVAAAAAVFHRSLRQEMTLPIWTDQGFRELQN